MFIVIFRIVTYVYIFTNEFQMKINQRKFNLNSTSEIRPIVLQKTATIKKIIRNLDSSLLCKYEFSTQLAMTCNKKLSF